MGSQGRWWEHTAGHPWQKAAALGTAQSRSLTGVRQEAVMLRALARVGVLSTIILLASVAGATPYWITWEGNDYPENEGWERSVYNNPDVRTLGGGMMTLDGLNTGGGWDGYEQHLQGSLDPDPGEVFIMRWRMRVEAIQAGSYDPSVFVFSDDAWNVEFHYAINRIHSPGEGPGGVVIPFAPGVFHTYEFRSPDMRTYQLWIDGQLVRNGFFRRLVSTSWVGWGDSGGFERSRSTWDYFRVGVAVPEASPLAAMALFGVAATSVRRR